MRPGMQRRLLPAKRARLETEPISTRGRSSRYRGWNVWPVCVPRPCSMSRRVLAPARNLYLSAQYRAQFIELFGFAEGKIARAGKRHLDVGDDLRGAAPHDEHAISEQHGLANTVRHEEHRFAIALPEFEQHDVHVVSRYGIECAERLVHQQNAWIGNERAAERYPLAHPARKLPRALVDCIVEVHQPQTLHGTSGRNNGA